MIDKFDLTLEELRKISATEVRRHEELIKDKSSIYNNAAQCLKQNLIEAAQRKRNEYELISMDADEWDFPELGTNIHCGWRDGKITPEMVVNNSTAFKIIYEYCEARGLKSQIDFYDDNEGNNAVFSIKIVW